MFFDILVDCLRRRHNVVASRLRLGLHSLAPARVTLRAAFGVASCRSQRLGFDKSGGVGA